MTKKTSAKEEIALMNKSAERLSYVRAQIQSREERFKEETDELFKEEKALREDILVGLQTMGLRSIGTTNGDSYFIAKTNDFEIRDALAYEKWARDERCIAIDKKLVKQRLREALKNNALPEFATAVSRETINVKSAKTEPS